MDHIFNVLQPVVLLNRKFYKTLIEIFQLFLKRARETAFLLFIYLQVFEWLGRQLGGSSPGDRTIKITALCKNQMVNTKSN
jgi:hypothetical protein